MPKTQSDTEADGYASGIAWRLAPLRGVDEATLHSRILVALCLCGFLLRVLRVVSSVTSVVVFLRTQDKRYTEEKRH